MHLPWWSSLRQQRWLRLIMQLLAWLRQQEPVTLLVLLLVVVGFWGFIELADEVMEGVSGDGKHGMAIAFRVVESIQQVDAPGSGGCYAHAKPARVLRIPARCKGRRFLVPDLNEADLFLIRAECLEYSVDTISRQAEDGVDSPFDQTGDKQIGDCSGHSIGLHLQIHAVDSRVR